MNNFFNIILSFFILLAIYFVYSSLAKPIEFNKALTIRSEAVKEKLKCLQKFQKYMEATTGNFSGDLRKDLIKTKSSTLDSLNIKKCFLNEKNLLNIPYTNSDFEIHVDTIDFQNKKRVVIEIKTSYKNFMTEFLNNQYRKYYNDFNPDDELAIGDLITPSIKENWP